MRRCLAGVVTACVAGLVAASPAAAFDKLVTIKSDGPGPAAYDQVDVHQVGPKNADRVLVLMPGTQGGAGDFTLLGRDLTKRVEGLQVWSIDRRTQALEDTSVFAQALAGRQSLQEMFDYYLGWLTGGGGSAPTTSSSSMPAPSRSPASGGWRPRSRTPARSCAPPTGAGAR